MTTFITIENLCIDFPADVDNPADEHVRSLNDISLEIAGWDFIGEIDRYRCGKNGFFSPSVMGN
ncbi:MAG TPA: hypothetical protein O0X23_05000 [Methanocorpusculum sp.]|nr:hypothetical protein [Methanocorpusculum sp.]